MKYRNKNIVPAIQWDGQNQDLVKEFMSPYCSGFEVHSETIKFWLGPTPTQSISVNDWIVNERNSFYVFSNELFIENFEPL